MSYIQFQQICGTCGEHWNAAFGIVGSAFIAEPPKECPFCNSSDLRRYADGWVMKPIPSGRVEQLD